MKYGFLGVLLMLIGCSDSGLYEVSGKVTWGGKPVPAGWVIIEPDPAHGNTGPQSRAPIKDGVFRTQAGRGAIAGHVLISIEGFDGVYNPENAMGKAIFSPYPTTAEFPRKTSTVDFDVPASHK